MEETKEPVGYDNTGETKEPVGETKEHVGETTEQLSDEIDPLDNFIGPVSQHIMVDPVITSNGMTYERSQIEQWFENHNTDPLTGIHLPNKILIPNFALRNAIVEWNNIKDIFRKNKHCCDYFKNDWDNGIWNRGDFNTTIKIARENYINELESENERRHQRRLRRSGYRGGTKTKCKPNKRKKTNKRNKTFIKNNRY